MELVSRLAPEAASVHGKLRIGAGGVYSAHFALQPRARGTQRGGGESGVASSTGGFAADGSGEPKDEGALGVRALLPLVAMLYSLLGPKGFDGDEVEESEQRLRETVLQACLRDPSCGGLLAPHAQRVPLDRLGAEGLMACSQLSGAIDAMFERLRAPANCPPWLGASEALMLSSTHTAGDEFTVRYCARCSSERSRVRRSWRCIGPTRTRLAVSASGANLLGVKRISRLTDHRTIVLFVLGGISLGEVRELRQLVAQYPKHRLLLGGTQLVSPDAVWDALSAGLHGR